MATFGRIRYATAEDVPFIRAQEDDPANIHVHAYDDARHRRNLEDASYYYFIAEDETGTPIGFAILIQNTPVRVEWRRIIIAREARGTGKQFMRATLALLFDEKGAESVWLDVYEENSRARHVYASLGFTETGTDTRSVPGHCLILMECTKAV